MWLIKLCEHLLDAGASTQEGQWTQLASNLAQGERKLPPGEEFRQKYELGDRKLRPGAEGDRRP